MLLGQVYRWQVINGGWRGPLSLATLFLELYIIVNEQNNTIAKAWDSLKLNFTFRRIVDHNLLMQWYKFAFRRTINHNLSFSDQGGFPIDLPPIRELYNQVLL
jgi:hypothetical protein